MKYLFTFCDGASFMASVVILVSWRSRARWGWAEARGAELLPQLHSRERLRTATRERTVRRAPKHCNPNRNRVQSAMLRPIQQDLLSTLVNLKVPYADAYSAALANTAASFDEAFRIAMAELGHQTKERFEKSRKAAA